MKYGSNTKWCTTMDSGKYFANYSKWGILIYALNKKTGYKFASFKNLNENRDKEFSFWNPADNKIDPLDILEIPTEIISIIRKEVNTNSVSNTCYMSEPILKKFPDLVLDGELYTDKIPFEELAGLIKKKKLSDIDIERLKLVSYHVYDCYHT